MSEVDFVPLDRDETAAIWCLSLSEGELSRADQQAFDEWVRDPDNAAALEEAAHIWGVTLRSADAPEVIGMRRAALDNFMRANRRRWSVQHIGRFAWVGAVAAMLLVAVSLTLLLREPSISYATKIGERRVVVLADNSRVSLDGDSDVEIRMKPNRRELKLIRGRAKFDVSHDPLRPFTVAAGDKLVIATGTSFSVEMVDGSVRVVLFSGHVSVLDRVSSSVTQPTNAKAVKADWTLDPGTELVARETVAQRVITRPVGDPGAAQAWEGGQLSLDDEPLSVAVERSNRYARRPIEIKDPDLGRIRVSGVFAAGDSAAFAYAVSALHNDIEVEDTANSVVIRKK